jgi:CheY-like chemotaxis protein
MGIEAVRRNPPDMVLLDIMMPVMDGYQVLEALRSDQDPRVSGVPVIVVSNSGQPVEIDRALKFSVQDYFVKASFDPDQVIAKIRKHLPNAQPTAADHLTALPSETEIPSHSADSEKPTQANIKILIIEDDKFLRDLEVAKLSRVGFSVVSASDGEQGLAVAGVEHPNIILLDILLPGMDGFEVLSRLRTTPEFAKMKVVMLSNFGQREDIDRAQKLGAVKYLIKANYTLDEIVEEVKQVAAS